MKFNLIFSVLLVIGAFAHAQENNEPAANNSTMVAPSTTDTVKTSKVVEDDEDFFSKSSFGIMWYSLSGYDDVQFHNPDPSFAMFDSYVAFSWRLPNDIRLSLLPTFGYTTSGYDGFGNKTTDKFYWRDFSIAVAQNHLLEDYLPAKWDLKQKARLYLPTSDGSKAQGMIARLRLEFETRYHVDRYSYVRIYAKPSYYFQRSTTYLNPNNNMRTTYLADSEHGAEYSWDINKWFALQPGFAFQEAWNNRSDANSADLAGRYGDYNAVHQSEIDYRFGIETRPTRDMSFIFGIQDAHDLAHPGETPQTSYTLLANITLL
jgi:hypothetical protein